MTVRSAIPLNRIATAPLAALDNLFAKRSQGERVRPDTPDWAEIYRFRGQNLAFKKAWENNEAHTLLLAGPAETGKTLTVLALLHEACLENPKLECLLVRKVKRHCYGTVCRTLLNKIWPGDYKEKGYVVYGGENSPDIFIYPNGSRIYVAGMDSVTQTETVTGVNALLSGEYDIIAVSQTEELSANDIWKLKSRCTGRAGNLQGKRRAGMIMDCNPAGRNHPLLQMDRDKSLLLFKSTHRDNPDLYDDDGELTERGKLTMEVLGGFKGVMRSRLLEGLWTGAGGAYFMYVDPVYHGIRKSDFVLGLDDEVWCSFDYGFAHPSVFQAHTIQRDIHVTFQELSFTRMRPHQIAPTIHATMAEWGIIASELRIYAGTDAFRESGHSSTIADQYAEHELFMIKADMSPGSRIKGAHKLLDLIGNPAKDEPASWMYVRETCEKLETCLPELVADPKNAEDVLKIDANDLGEGGDDSYDCLRYGLRDLNMTSSMSGLDEKLKKLKEKMRA